MTTEEMFYGTWSCEYKEESEGESFSLVYEDTYIRNGRVDSFGYLTFTVPELPGEELEYSIAATSDWEVQGKFLVMKVDDLKIVNLSHPGLDDVFSLEDIFPKGVSESAEIVDISATKLVLRSESDNSITQCSR
jgi:hypothetical protein